jgi:hypothetical protein
MTLRWDVATAIAEMGRSGSFYLRVRPGLKPALWTRGHRLGARPANRDQLATWLEDRDVESPYTLATAVMKTEWKDEFTVLDDSAMKNADLLL